MYVLERIFETAQAAPQKLAAVFNNAPLTYGAFWRLIDARRRSLKPNLEGEGFVLLWIDNLLEAWILDLAVRSLGFHTAQIRTVDQLALFARFQVAGVISLADEAAKPVEGPLAKKHMVLGDPAARLADAAWLPPPLPSNLKRGGHVLFTSGTTGDARMVPAGFGSTRESVERRVALYRALGERFVQPGSATVVNVFNYGLWAGGGYHWPLFAWGLGGAVAFSQAPELQAALAWPGLTHTHVTPWYLSQLMAQPPGAFAQRPGMQLVVGAGALSPALWRQTASRLTSRVHIDLASTEIGVWARTTVASEADLNRYEPAPNRRVEVVSETGDPLAVGELGQIRVGLREEDPPGYLGDPPATAEVFRGGWYYPGDLGSYGGDGRLTLHGRASETLNILGGKVPVAPWEAALRDKLRCDDVCLIAGALRGDQPELHVFLETQRSIPIDELAAALRSTLTGFPEFHAHPVASLPRTDTGKVRRLLLAQQLREGAFQIDPAARY